MWLWEEDCTIETARSLAAGIISSLPYLMILRACIGALSFAMTVVSRHGISFNARLSKALHCFRARFKIVISLRVRGRCMCACVVFIQKELGDYENLNKKFKAP